MLNHTKHAHILAVGGIGMSAVCLLLLKKGFTVSGSDSKRTPLIDEMIAKGLKFQSEADMLDDQVDLLIYSSATSCSHPKRQEALSKKITQIHRAQALNALMVGKKVLLVAGTHGKTTTSSLLTMTLKALGVKPSYAIGGTFSQKMDHADFDDGEFFIAEADESDGSFLNYEPDGMIVTNIDLDHMDFWKTKEQLEKGFLDFMSLCDDKKMVIYHADDLTLSNLGVVGTTYGCSLKSDFKLVFDEAISSGREFVIQDIDQAIYKGCLQINGHHNALNACGVFALLRRLGFEAKEIINAMAQFSGVDRRCQFKGMIGQSLWIDDYGHHPTEIKTTLKGIKEKFPNKRVLVIFQPHRFSRTQDLWHEFFNGFFQDDHVIITDIYGAGEKNPLNLHSQDLATLVSSQLGGKVAYQPREELSKLNFHHDVIITFGAGDITHLYGEVSCR